MIEAVNSTIANATASRGVVEQVDAASIAAVSAVLPPLPEGAPTVPQAPFVSPYIIVDLDFDKAVLQIRDSETGDVQDQFPSESRLAQIRRARDIQERVELQQRQQVNETPVQTSTPSPQSADVVTIQDVTSAQVANTPLSSPQIAIAALSTGAQSGQSNQSTNVSVLA